jgi:hypothetical protein
MNSKSTQDGKYGIVDILANKRAYVGPPLEFNEDSIGQYDC